MTGPGRGGLRETEKYKETKIQRDAQIQRDTQIQRDKQIQRHIQTHKKSSQSIKKLYTENNMAEEGGKRLDETDQYKVKYRETHKYKYRQAIKFAEISIYHDKATPWLRRVVSDQGRKATSVETSRKTPICIHLFTHLSILHSFIQLTNLSGCIFVLIFWLVCLVRLEFIFLQKLQFSY